MSAEKTAKPPIPRWAWIFAAVCMVIPISTIGGAIPTAIGAFAALGVIGIARQTGKPTRTKAIYCGVVTGSAWTVFLVFLLALTSLQAKHPKLKPALNQHIETKQAARKSPDSQASLARYSSPQTAAPAKEIELTPEKRQKIYSMAVRMRYHIESAEEQRRKLKAKGFDVASRDEQIARLEQREQDHFDFVTRFYKIERNQLDQIVAEGDRAGWPTK